MKILEHVLVYRGLGRMSRKPSAPAMAAEEDATLTILKETKQPSGRKIYFIPSNEDSTSADGAPLSIED